MILTRIFGKSIPLHVVYYTTYRCMLTCSFCHRRNWELSELSTEEAKELMRSFHKQGTVVWSFNGGEPLVRRDLGELIEYSKSLGFFTTLNTNGYTVKQNRDIIKQVDHVDLSLDGDPELHNEIRGAKAYEHAIDALGVLQEEKIDTHIMTVLVRENLEHLDYLIEIAEQFGASIKFQPVAVHPQDLDHESENQFPSREELGKAIDFLLDQKREGRPIACSNAYLNAVKENWPTQPNGISCYAGRSYCNITPEGRITPCCALVSKVEVDGPKTNPEIASYEEAFHNIPDLKNCQDCFYNGPLEFNLLFGFHPEILRYHLLKK